MYYVIYNKETTVLLKRPSDRKCLWGSKGAATRAFNDAVKAGAINADEYAIAESSEFYNNIEKQEIILRCCAFLAR